MTDQDLAYWLQGAFEIAGLTAIDDEQAACIRRHVALVRVTSPNSAFAAQIDALMGVARGEERAALVRPVVDALFAVVIDPKHPKPKLANAAHHSHSGQVLYRY